MKSLKDTFKLDLNNSSAVKQFYKILNRYRIGKKDKNDFFEKSKETNKSAENVIRYFKLKIPRLRPISELPDESRYKILDLIGNSDLYYGIENILMLNKPANQENHLVYNVNFSYIKNIFAKIDENPSINYYIAELYIGCYGNKLTKVYQENSSDGSGWETPIITTLELDELIVEKEITKEEYYQKVYDKTKYPME